MARAATCYDAPPILEPTPEILDAINAYEASLAAFDRLPEDYALRPRHELLKARIKMGNAVSDAWNALENAIPCDTGWYVVGDIAYGWTKVDRCGLTLVKRPTRSKFPRQKGA